ncbi:MAG: HD domain-containing phosphohydrolase [Suilimivivens sp.]|nr:response regulator [Lachnospiraceae bacterium]
MRNKILIVDDVEINRELLEEILKDEYEILQAENGKQALQVLEKFHDDIAVMLLDLIMPEMDGLTLLEEMNQKPWSNQIAVVIISSENTVQTEARCFELGVSDFVHRPFNNRLVRKRVRNVATLFQYQQELEQKVEKQTETLRKQYKLLQLQAEQLKQSKANVIDILGNVVECRNLESGEHIKRVKGYTRILGERLMEDYPEYGLTKEKMEIIVSASALHDIGKIAVPDAILLKPGKLTQEEFEYMKSHTTRGCEILNNIKNVWDKEYGTVSYEICRHHHERYDGKGYPDGLKGEEIPVSAQIVSIADVYDALVNERVYKSAFSKEKAFQMIVTGECGIFSPKLLECFWNVRKDFENLADAAEA